MALDLAAELVAALRSPSGRQALCEALEPMVGDVITRVLDKRDETLKPLAEILGIGNDAARKRESRIDGLKALAVKSGRRRLYLASQVRAFLQGKK